MNTDDSLPELGEQIAREKSADELAAFNRTEDLKWLMGNLRGRRFMMNLLDKTGFRREPMTGNAHTYFNLGAAKIGRDLEGEIFAECAELYVQMIKENS